MKVYINQDNGNAWIEAYGKTLAIGPVYDVEVVHPLRGVLYPTFWKELSFKCALGRIETKEFEFINYDKD